MLISVIIPVLNGQAFIEKAISSALSQKEVYEVIVVDNGSTDNTYNICETIAKKQQALKVILAPEKKSPAYARNIGLRMASGKYISFLDADDYYLPGRFTESIQLLEKNLTIDAVYCPVKNINITSSGQESYKYASIIYPDSEIDPKSLFKKAIQDTNNLFSIISLVVKTSIVRQIGFFDDNLLYSEDIDYIYRLSNSYKVIGIRTFPPLIMRIIHGGNMTMNDNYNPLTLRFQLTKKWFNLMKNKGFQRIENIYIIRRYLAVLSYEQNPDFGKIIRILFKTKNLFLLIINNPIILKRIVLR